MQAVFRGLVASCPLQSSCSFGSCEATTLNAVQLGQAMYMSGCTHSEEQQKHDKPDDAGSPAAIRAAAAVAVSIGHLAAALLALRKQASSSEAALTQLLLTRPSLLSHEPHGDAAGSLDAMYPSPAAQGLHDGPAAPNSHRAAEPSLKSMSQGLNGNSSLALALSRAGKPAMLLPRLGIPA